MDLLRGTRELEAHGRGLDDWEVRVESVTTIGSSEEESAENGFAEIGSGEGIGIAGMVETCSSEGFKIAIMGSEPRADGVMEEGQGKRSELTQSTEAWRKTKSSKNEVEGWEHST